MPGAWRLVLDTVALTSATVTVAVLLVGALYAVLQYAFRELRLDAPLAAIVGAGTAAVAAVLVGVVASVMTARAISVLLVLVATGGAVASMVSAPDPLWWQNNLSALGAGTDLSAAIFNATLVFAGLVVASLAGYLEADLRGWSPAPGWRRIRAVRSWLVAVGALVAGVGLVSVAEDALVHTLIATTMGVAFVVLVGCVPVLLPGVPRWFRRASIAVVVTFVVAVLLMWPVGYLNLTGLELVGAAVLMVWIVLFGRAATPAGAPPAPAVGRAAVVLEVGS